MGAYTEIRGWIEIPEWNRDTAINIIEEYKNKGQEFSFNDESTEWYQKGWVIQPEPVNMGLHIFFGGRVRTEAVPFIKTQVEEIANLRYDDEENGLNIIPQGLFHLDEDGTYDIPSKMWVLEDGVVIETER
ncbi:MAG: hypothetical protein OEZ02_10640 [Anaerolineae bacterium]|nr:hypothetical protein [Anaerolineae bacterium]